jgi:murein DD-endopeptidase
MGGVVLRAVPAVAAALLAACASFARVSPAPEGAAVAAAAAALVGTPYRFGGADSAGFDCSGLALYAYESRGIAIPRTAAEQQRLARPVPLGQLAPGDLLFFNLHARGIDHVGIYTGESRFVHARGAGLAVAYGTLHAGGYYARHLVSAGRFWGAEPSPR